MSMGFMNGPAQELQSDFMVLSGNYAAGMTARPPRNVGPTNGFPYSPFHPNVHRVDSLPDPASFGLVNPSTKMY